MALYDDLRGREGIFAIVNRLYTKILDDDELSPFFRGLLMDRQKRMLTAYLTVATGGPGEYSGRGLAAAHKEMVREKGLSDHHFDRMCKHLVGALMESGIGANDTGRALAIIEATRNDVLCRSEGQKPD